MTWGLEIMLPKKHKSGYQKKKERKEKERMQNEGRQLLTAFFPKVSETNSGAGAAAGAAVASPDGTSEDEPEVRDEQRQGGGSGIGRAVCKSFASEGASVVIADYNQESAYETLELLTHDYRRQEHMALGVDASLKDSVARLLNNIQSHYFQPPSICVSAAGITQDGFLLSMEEEDFDRVIQVNLKGTFLLTQAVAKALVAAGATKGSIITVGSIVGKVGNIGQINYSASKAGVEGLTRTAARELSRYGIRCNCVLPGFIATPMTEKVPEKVMNKITSSIMMGRMGKPAEVADVCAFLASDDSRYITGVSIEVAGGLFLG